MLDSLLVEAAAEAGAEVREGFTVTEIARERRADPLFSVRYVWIHAWVQEALFRVTVTAGLRRAEADVRQLAHIAATSHQPDFSVHAELHRAALGEPSALNRARAMATKLDNPALTRTTTRRYSPVV